METDKKTVIKWIKEHKKELIIAGVCITTMIAVIIGINNQKGLDEAWASLRILVEKTPETSATVKTISVAEAAPIREIVDLNIVAPTKIPHNVAEHLRNLPKGCKASAEKIATAAAHGFELLPGQTWVEAYSTGKLAA